ncbi:NAD(P)-binding protein [Candidatus Dojkabacteria bacterium]|nr:NAD(P)-binding protein [Candidatus Dojkabacteria bacterium]
MTKKKVIIAGGGIAGMYTAISLSQYGNYSITIIDQKTDLSATGFNTLGSFIEIEKYGFPEEVIASKIDTTVMHSSHFSHKANGHAYILDKVKLHQYLQEDLRKNRVSLKLGNKISDIHNENGYIKALILENKEKVAGDLFVDASGINSILAKHMKLANNWDKKAYGIEYEIEYTGEQNKAIFFIGNYVKGGYGWLFPLKDNKAILGIGTFDKSKQKKLRENVDRLLTHPSIKKYVKGKNQHIQGGVIPVREPETKFVLNNLVCVGDSVAQVNPMVGEGYRFIIDSAEMAAAAIHKAMVTNNLECLHEYEEEWKSVYLQQYKLAYKLQQLIDKIGRYDALLDLGVLFLHTKRDSTVERLYAGNFTKRDLFLP